MIPTLVSHHLCPYVQRAVIALSEKRMPFERVDIDLSNKPAWFRAISPLGKVPLLRVPTPKGEAVIFESAVIVEYLEETAPKPLHPGDPLERARHRAWIEMASAILTGIARFYSAPDEDTLATAAGDLGAKFAQVEAALGEGPYFAGERFSLVDAAFGPVFRYFNTFDRIGDFGILDGKPRLARWRTALAERPSVTEAAPPDYPARLEAFIAARGSALSHRMRSAA